jgi:hypothetical protein
LFLGKAHIHRNPSADLGKKFLRQYDQALIELSRIDVLVNSATELTLSATFKASLRQAITGGYVKTKGGLILSDWIPL